MRPKPTSILAAPAFWVRLFLFPPRAEHCSSCPSHFLHNRYLVSGDSYKTLSFLFRVSPSAVCNIVRETNAVLYDVLQPLVLVPPSEEKWKEIAQEMDDRWQFPNCIGALDGKHVVMQVYYLIL